jgi:hypothetical protein
MTNVIREIASQRKSNYSSYSSHPANCESRAEQYWTWPLFFFFWPLFFFFSAS